MNTKASPTIATYFGLEVEVITRMETWSLIRYQARELVVETCELVFTNVIQRAA
jgi:hypothetical protein